MYCAFPFPSPIYNSKTGGVSSDFLVVDTIVMRRSWGNDGNVGWEPRVAFTRLD